MLSKFTTRLGGALVLGCALLSTHAQSTNSELVVQFKASATDAEIQQAIGKGHLKVKKHTQTAPMKERGQAGLTLAETDLPADQAIEQLKNDVAVEFAEPNAHYQHQAVSNDSWYVSGNMWGVYGDLSTPANAFGSQAAEAWAAGYVGTNNVYVAVIDEGIDYTHPELAPNFFTNPWDAADGSDNDGNGYADDVHGWNFADHNNVIFDSTTDDHGTHVAGTIGARGGNGSGVAGVNWNVTILSGKFLSATGGDTLAAVSAIDYFVDMKKRHNLKLVAINASWGGTTYSRALHEAILRAAKANIIFVAAAGNSSNNNDATAFYPACIDTRVGTSSEAAASYDAVISVAAIDSTGALASFSNYGSTKVHIGAPGVDILSTYPNAQVAYMSGTSMAAPHVTGAVALYASTHPGAAASTIRNAILGAVIPTPSLSGKCSTGGRLNLSRVITPATTTTTPPPTTSPAVPTAPTGVSGSATVATVAGNSTATVKWTAVSGASSYKVKRASSAAGPWTVIASGVTTTSYSQTVTAGATQYYDVVATNASGDSADSTAAAVATTSPTPANLTVTATSSTTATLKWTDRTSDEQGFKVEYYNGSSWTQLGTVVAGVTGASLSGMASKVTYQFRVRAYNGALNTGYSNVGSVTLP